MKSLFFYGTLRDAETLALVLGPFADGIRVGEATLPDHCVFSVTDEDFPTLVAEPGSEAAGLLVENLDPAALDRLIFFEDGFDYALRPVEVLAEGARRPAEVFFSHGPKIVPDGPWDYARWRREQQPAFAAAARELMAHYGTTPEEEVDRIWPGIRTRSFARARAATEPVRAELRHGLGAADVQQGPVSRPYLDLFAVEAHEVTPARFDGAAPTTIRRTALASGDAITVLPWDPMRDRVLLVEQFRIGPHARGDRMPWTLEAVAGRIDAATSAEATARREAEEEAGLTLGRLARIGRYYPSPGLLAESIESFVGEADLAEAGGLHGLAYEDEDIRAFTCSRAEAMQAAASGEIATGPLLLTLYWLEANAARLRDEWRD